MEVEFPFYAGRGVRAKEGSEVIRGEVVNGGGFTVGKPQKWQTVTLR